MLTCAGFLGPLCGTCTTDAACQAATNTTDATCDTSFTYGSATQQKRYTCTTSVSKGGQKARHHMPAPITSHLLTLWRRNDCRAQQ